MNAKCKVAGSNPDSICTLLAFVGSMGAWGGIWGRCRKTELGEMPGRPHSRKTTNIETEIRLPFSPSHLPFVILSVKSGCNRTVFFQLAFLGSMGAWERTWWEGSQNRAGRNTRKASQTSRKSEKEFDNCKISSPLLSLLPTFFSPDSQIWMQQDCIRLTVLYPFDGHTVEL
jgi:hypothetical protein